jgi:hypothetical protein
MAPGWDSLDSASTRNKYEESSWGIKDGWRIRLDNLVAICEQRNGIFFAVLAEMLQAGQVSEQ